MNSSVKLKKYLRRNLNDLKKFIEQLDRGTEENILGGALIV